MEIAIEKTDDITVAGILTTELDASNCVEFKRDISPVLEGGGKVVLDLSRIGFVDSSGLGAILSCLRQLTAKGGVLKLCGMSHPVQASFELVRMHKIFDIFGNREEAIGSFQ